MEHLSWERPIDLVAAMISGKAIPFNSLNLINNGQMPDLPSSVFVETPCTASAQGPIPQTVALPPTVLPYCERIALLSDAIVRAARERKRALVEKSVELDPTILDKQAGIRAINTCLHAHADILPAYS